MHVRSCLLAALMVAALPGLLVSLSALPLQAAEPLEPDRLHSTATIPTPMNPTLGGMDDRILALQGTLTGRVTEEGSGRMLPGAQVEVVGTGLGSLSGSNGSFSIANVPVGQVEVRVQMLGYAPRTESVTIVSGQSVNLEIILRRQALALDEVIVTGTAGGAQRRSIGNVVDRVDIASVREVSPAQNVQELLAGRVPGLIVDPGGGQVGAGGAPIRIRGSSSAALNNDPIIYIDGVRMNSDPVSGNATGGRDGRASRLNDVNPEDIASIEVIKGPAAATLYGTEASNGVIQIITKRGQSGENQFNFSSSLGGTWFHDPEGTIPDAFWTNPDTREIIGFNIVRQERETGNGDIFQTGLSQEYNLSARGGTDRLRYFASVRQNRADGVVDWNWTRNTAVRANIDFLARENLDISINSSYSTGQTRQTGEWFRRVFWSTPATNVFAGGRENRLRGFDNAPPEALRDDLFVRSNVNRMNMSGTANFTPLSWLSSRTTFGVDITETSNTTLWTADPLGAGGFFGADSRGRRDVQRIQNEVISFDHSTTARFQLNESLGSATSGGFQVFDRTDWVTFARGDQLPARPVTTVGGAAETRGNETFVQNVTVGGFVQQELDWQQRLFVTGAVRIDENSAFGEESSAVVFPKLSGAWVLHEEDFFHIRGVSQLRLRAAWGRAGMQPDAFDAARLFRAETGPGDAPVLTPQAFGNPDLQPEIGSEVELGFDAGFLDDRISLEFTQFFRSTTDAIVQRGLPPSGGFPGSQLVNLGQVDNWGTELQVNTTVIQRERLRWNLGGGLALQRNEIKDLGPDTDVIAVSGVVGAGDRQHRVDFALADWFHQRILSADFVSGSSGAVTNLMCDGGTGEGNLFFGGEAVPCSEAPRLFWGRSEPTWIVNLNTSVDVGDFQLFASADGRGGHLAMDNGINASSTSFSTTLKANEQTDPIFMAYRQIGRSPIGFHRGDFLKLREVALRYRIPDEWVGGFGVRAASLNVSARNLATIWQKDEFHFLSGVRVMDPEITRPGQSFQGEAQATPPPNKTFLVTLRFAF